MPISLLPFWIQVTIIGIAGEGFLAFEKFRPPVPRLVCSSFSRVLVRAAVQLNVDSCSAATLCCAFAFSEMRLIRRFSHPFGRD
jgi:hypothetical protein